MRLCAAASPLVVYVRAMLSDSAMIGLIVDLDLLLADVPLYYLLFLDDLLAQVDLLLGNGALLDDDFFLDDGHKELLLADLALRRLPALNGHPIYVHLLAPLWHLHPLTVGPHPLTYVYAANLALAGTGYKLLFGPLHPKLVLAFSKVTASLAQLFLFLLASVHAELSGLGVLSTHAMPYLFRALPVLPLLSEVVLT